MCEGLGMKTYAVNWWRLLLTIVFYVHQNSYFGWHRAPQSEAELIADGLVLLLAALSVQRRERA